MLMVGVGVLVDCLPTPLIPDCPDQKIVNHKKTELLKKLSRRSKKISREFERIKRDNLKYLGVPKKYLGDPKIEI